AADPYGVMRGFGQDALRAYAEGQEPQFIVGAGRMPARPEGQASDGIQRVPPHPDVGPVALVGVDTADGDVLLPVSDPGAARARSGVYLIGGAGSARRLPPYLGALRTKVDVDPIAGRVRSVHPEAGTVRQTWITPGPVKVGKADSSPVPPPPASKAQRQQA